MNIGILGSGFIVDVFCENSKMYKDINTYAIWGRHEEKIKKFTNFKKYYTNVDEFFNDKNIDVVYVALPNSLHFEYAHKALKAGKHVLLEKPFCLTTKQAKTLMDYAKKQKLFLFETIMTLHAPNYIKLKSFINKIGEIKMVDANFSQYSRRYEKFKNGITLPAFDYKLAGGALLDLGVYNIHFVCGLFGKPKAVNYYPNILKKVDTSGVLVLDYGKFKANLVAAKDCKAECFATIQGDKGYIKVNSTTSRCSSFDIVYNDGTKKSFVGEDGEFVAWKTLYGDIIKIYKKKDYDACYKLLDNTLIVQKVLEQAIKNGKLNY